MIKARKIRRPGEHRKLIDELQRENETLWMRLERKSREVDHLYHRLNEKRSEMTIDCLTKTMADAWKFYPHQFTLTAEQAKSLNFKECD